MLPGLTRVLAPTVLLALAAGIATGCGDDESEDESAAAGTADNTVELSGRIDQVGESFDGYGVVTRIEGVDPAALTDAGGSEITEGDARVTFVFDAELESRTVVGDSFSLATEGTATFYLDDDPGASFDEPESFAEGEEIAAGGLRVTNVVTVYAPDSGIATATGSIQLDESSSFELDGAEASIGASGDEFRVTLTGRGTRTNAVIPESNFDFAGQLVLVE